MEKALKEAYQSLEKRGKERRAELEEAYKSLQENERRLSEVQKIARIGSWDWDLIIGDLYLSDELSRIFGLPPQDLGLSYDEALKQIHLTTGNLRMPLKSF